MIPYFLMTRHFWIFTQMNKLHNISATRIIGCAISYYTILGRFMHAIDMPIFFFISGYLYSNSYIYKNKYKNPKPFLLSKIKRLMLPYLFWGIFLCFIMPDRYQEIGLLKGLSHLWFLFTLFTLFLITSIKRTFWLQLNLKKVAYIIMISIFLYWICCYAYNISSYLCLRQTILYLPVFAMGLWTGRNGFSKVSLFTLTALFIGVFVCIYSDKHLLISFSNILGGGITYYILYHFQNKSSISKWLQSIDNCSMGIYIIHHIFIIWILQYNAIKEFMIAQHFIAPIVMFIIIFPLSWLITYYMKKAKYLSSLIG